MTKLDDGEGELADLALVPLTDNFPSKSPQFQRTLLPSPLASVVSLVTATSSLSLRVGGLFGSAAINGAKITTLTGLELGRAVLEGVLGRAGQDVIETSTGIIGRAAAEKLLRTALSSLHYTITQTSFLISAGFQIGSSSLNASLLIGQYLLTILEGVFGDNETSKAIATIIVLVQREIDNPDVVGSAGERVGIADIITGVAGFAMLQRWCRRRTIEHSAGQGSLDLVWDIVVLAETNSQTMALARNRSDEPPIYPSQHESSARTHRPESSASFMSALGDGDNFEGYPNDDGRSFMSSASNRQNFDRSSDGAPNQAFCNHLSQQLKPGSTVKVTAHSMTINSVTVEVQGDDSSSLDPPSGYSLVSADESHGGRRLVFQNRTKGRHSGDFEVSKHDLFSSSRGVSRSSSPRRLSLLIPDDDAQMTDDTSSPYPLRPAIAIGSPSTLREPDLPSSSRHLANQKRQRTQPLSTATRYGSVRHPAEQGSEPDKKPTIRQSLKSRASYKGLVDFFYGVQPRKRPADTQQGSDGGLSVHTMKKHDTHSLASSNTMMQGRPHNLQAGQRSDYHPFSSARNGDYQLHSHMHSKRMSVSSIHSVAASESSIVLHSGADDTRDEAISRMLNRKGILPGQFPDTSFAQNLVRFCRFSIASYGSSFVRLLGASAEGEAQRLNFASKDHHEHQSFTSYTGLPPSTVLLSSFVDPHGIPLASDGFNTGTTLVHFVSLDHDAKAVVLSCRGTLGFEDIVTDLAADYVDFKWQEQTYRVHQGMLAAAQKLLTLDNGRVISTIRAALLEFTDYGLVLCGHSLGGGVASVLAMMLAQSNRNKFFGNSAFVTSLQPERRREVVTGPDGSSLIPEFALPPGRPIHVYAFGPAASVSPALQEATKGLVTSIIQGQDIVPFLSLGILRDFQHIALAFKTDSRDAKGEVRRRVWEGMRKAAKDCVGFGDRHAMFRDSWIQPPTSGDEEDDHWPWMCLESLRAGLKAQKLVPAGDIFIVQSKPALQRHAFTRSGRPEQSAPSFKPATHVTVKLVKDVGRVLGEIQFGTSMFMDHVPLRYERVLSTLARGLGE